MYNQLGNLQPIYREQLATILQVTSFICICHICIWKGLCAYNFVKHCLLYGCLSANKCVSALRVQLMNSFLVFVLFVCLLFVIFLTCIFARGSSFCVVLLKKKFSSVISEVFNLNGYGSYRRQNLNLSKSSLFIFHVWRIHCPTVRYILFVLHSVN